MSQEKWMWAKIYNLSLHKRFAPTKLVLKKAKNKLLSCSPDSAYSHTKMRQCKEKK